MAEGRALEANAGAPTPAGMVAAAPAGGRVRASQDGPSGIRAVAQRFLQLTRGSAIIRLKYVGRHAGVEV